MIRPFTIVCMLMAVGSGLYLYQCKHQAQMLDREIGRTIKQTEAARDRIGMLRAQWAQLNEPEKLAELARAHSALQTAKPTQFVAVNDLTGKLPAPIAATRPRQPTDLPEEGEAAPPIAQTEPPATPTPRVAVAATPQETRPASRATVAEAKPAPTPSPAPAAESKPTRRAATPTPASAQEATPQLASVRPAPHPMAPSRAIASSIPVSSEATAPGTVGAAVLRAMRARETQSSAPAPYVQPVAVPAPAYAPPAPQAYAAPALPSGSMLGGSRGSLPPPVPFAAR